MISVQVQNLRGATVEKNGTESWVTLRFGGFDRVAIHTRTFEHAVAIAAAINGEVDARTKSPEAAGA